MKHPFQTLFKVLCVGTVGFSGVAEAFHNVGLRNITPLHCNRVRLESVVSGGVVDVTNPVYLHLKDIDIGDTRFLKQVVKLQVGAEGGPLVL